VLEHMRATLTTLTQTFESLGEQSAMINALGPCSNPNDQILSLRKQIKTQDKRQETRIAEVKRIVKDALKDQIVDNMKAQIQDQIHEEIALQVREQVVSQIRSHLPILLDEQAEQSKRQLIQVQNALQNSEARRKNNALRAHNLDERLAVVFRPDGTESKYYPATMRVLFEYDAEQARALIEDYGLPVDAQREKNLNRFIAHVGVMFNVVQVPVVSTS